MPKINKEGARELKKEALGESEQEKGKAWARDLIEHFNRLHSIDRVKEDKEIEELLIEQKKSELAKMDEKPTYPKNLVKFNPSGASKTAMDLYLKSKGYKEEKVKYPYHNRWTRNSTAVHDVVQKDLLYAEKVLDNPKFEVKRTDEGLPAWEENVLKWVEIEHKGQKFILNGKSDGILEHTPTGETVGFELKTKTNTIGQVGYFKLKEPPQYHIEQTVAYYLLFGVRHQILMYEGVVKDHWHKGADAKPDIRAFYVYVTDEMVEELLDKWAYVSECVNNDTMPEDKELGFFSGYSYLFNENGDFIG